MLAEAWNIAESPIIPGKREDVKRIVRSLEKDVYS